MNWILIFVIYFAPDHAVDWDGPWQFGDVIVQEQPFESEADCLRAGIQIKGRVQQGMLAPIRINCVPAPAFLPEGAPR